MVRRTLQIELAQPRDQVTTRADPHFAQYRNEIYGEIKDAQSLQAS